MINKQMIEPCPSCGEQTVFLKDNFSVQCDNCGVVLFTPMELVGDKIF